MLFYTLYMHCYTYKNITSTGENPRALSPPPRPSTVRLSQWGL